MKKIILLVALATFGLSCQKEDVSTTPEVSATGIYPNGKSFKDVYSAKFDSNGIPKILIDLNKPNAIQVPAKAELFFGNKTSGLENGRSIMIDRITYKCIGSWWNGGWQAAKDNREKDMYITAARKNCGGQIDFAIRFLPRGAHMDSYANKAADFWYRIQISFTSTSGNDTRYAVHQMLKSGSTERYGARPFYDYAYGIGGTVTADFLRKSDYLDLLAWDDCYKYSRFNSRWLIYDCNDHSDTDGKNRLDIWMENGPGKENMSFREVSYSPW
jgi:hypothetical protein